MLTPNCCPFNVTSTVTGSASVKASATISTPLSRCSSTAELVRAPNPKRQPGCGRQRATVKLTTSASPPNSTSTPATPYDTLTAMNPSERSAAGTLVSTASSYVTSRRAEPPVSIETRKPAHTSASPNARVGSGPYRKLMPSAPQCVLMPACPQLPPDMRTEKDAVNALMGRSPSSAESTIDPSSP